MTEPTDAFPDALPTGTRLGDFVTTGVIGAGGFGTVYLAREESLDRVVAIKEYLPSAIAARGATQAVLPRSQTHREGFAAGLHSFMREARLQAQFSHPALLEVYRVWEQNGTAYMAMRYYPGTSLRELSKRPEAATGYDEAQILAYLIPVCDAVRELHLQNILHRDVSPDNILIMPNGAPVLLDFGAARTVVAGATQSLTTVLKPGYAPIEQYADDGSLEQGPWTDVYGLGAVMYFLAMGSPPPQAVNRMVFDSLNSFDEVTRGRYSTAFVGAVKRALAVRPENRFRSVDALCDALGWSLRGPIAPLQTFFAPAAGSTTAIAAKTTAAEPAAVTAPTPVVAPADVVPAMTTTVAPTPTPETATDSPAPVAATAKSRRPTRAVAIVLLLVAAGAVALFALRSRDDGNGIRRDAGASNAAPAPTTLPPPTAPSLPTSPTPQEPPAAAPAPAESATPPVVPSAAPTVAARKGSDERKPKPPLAAPAASAADRSAAATAAAPSRPARDADCDRLLTKLSLGTVALTEAERSRLRSCR